MSLITYLALSATVLMNFVFATQPIRVIDLSNEHYSSYLFDSSQLTNTVESNNSTMMSNLSSSTAEAKERPTERVVLTTNSRDDVKNPRVGELLKDIDTVIYFKESKSVVYYDKDKKEWYEYQLEEHHQPAKQKVFPQLIPVSSCIDSGYGDGGAITLSYASTFQLTDSLSFTGLVTISDFVISAMIGTSVAASYTYTETFTCNVNKGQYGQLFIEPFYVEIPKSSRRKVAYKKYQGLVAKSDLFEEISKFKLISKHKPNHYCVVDTKPSKLSCSRKVTEHQFKQSDLP